MGLRSRFTRHSRGDSGATIVEFGILIAGVGLASIAAFFTLQNALGGSYQSTSDTDPGTCTTADCNPLTNGDVPTAPFSNTVDYGAPGAPQAFAGVGHDGFVTLTWAAPLTTGGSPITGYTVTSVPGSAGCATSTLACTINGLTNNVPYDFSITATNQDGFVSAAAVVTATPIPPQPPSAPTGVTGVPGDGSVTVSWQASALDGGAALASYTATSSAGQTCTVAAPAVTCAVIGLSNGTAYTFTVTATNAASLTSVPSLPSASVTPRTTPDAPTAVSVTPAGLVSWTAPAVDGGSPITGFTASAYANASGGSAVSSCTASGAAAVTCTIPGLTAANVYYVDVFATNVAGDGPASSPRATKAAATAPGQVTGLNGSRGYRSVALTWTAPADGGDAISDYLVEYRAGSNGNWSTFSHTASTATSITVTGLTDNQSYQFQVSAKNSVGTGTASSVVSVTTAAVPSQVTGLSGTRAYRSVALSWTEPAANGDAISDYKVEYRAGNNGNWSTFSHTASTATSITVTGLTDNQSYQFRVSAINQVGAGPVSSTATVTTAAVPSQVTGLSGSRAYRSVALSWTEPAANGDAISDYKVEYRAGNNGNWSTFSHTASTATSITVTGLTDNQSYQFRVSAINQVGAGPVSSTATVTTAAVPSQVTGLGGTAGVQSVALSWTAPSANGDAISDYKVEYRAGNNGNWSTFSHTPSTATSITVTGLTTGQSYQFRVSAINQVGAGSVSTTLTRTPT